MISLSEAPGPRAALVQPTPGSGAEIEYRANRHMAELHNKPIMNRIYSIIFRVRYVAFLLGAAKFENVSMC